MLSSYNDEWCINPGVCLDIRPCFFFYRFLYCTKSWTKYGRMIMTRSSDLSISHSVIIVAINYMCLFKIMFAFYF